MIFLKCKIRFIYVYIIYVYMYILLKLLYTATTLACMPVYIVREVTTLLEWPVELLSKMLSGWMDGWVMGDTP